MLGLLTSGGGVIHHKNRTADFYVQSNDKKQIQAIASDLRRYYDTRVAWEEDHTPARKPLFRIVVDAKEIGPLLNDWPRRPGPKSHWQLHKDPHDIKTYTRGVFEGKGGNVSLSSKTVIARGERNPLKGKQITVVFTSDSEGVSSGMALAMSSVGAKPFQGLRLKGSTKLFFLRLANEAALRFLVYLYGDTPRYYTIARMKVFRELTVSKDRKLMRSIERPQVSVVTLKVP